ncbi:MAG: hypothetical protein ACRCTJ_03905, partial [Brevinema sp.]
MNFRILSVLLLIIISTNYSFENKIIAIIGDTALTSFDINQMKGFELAISGNKISSEEALTKLINNASLLTFADNYPDYYMSEAELRKSINTLTNNPADPGAQERKNVLMKYENIYRLFLRADKVKKGLIGGNIHIRAEMNHPIPPNEIKDFYTKNKERFTDSPYPKLDLIIFAVETSPKWTLSDLEHTEDQLNKLSARLDSSSDTEKIRKEFSKTLKFTSYSGRT